MPPMRKANNKGSALRRLIVFFLIFLAAGPSAAEMILSAPGSDRSSLENGALPREYGEIVYRYNEKSPYQLYIVGIGHRHSLLRTNGSATARSQAETYKIGEWLVMHEGVGLLLPEGFFNKQSVPVEYEPFAEARPEADETFDLKTLEEELSNDTVYLNAEMLLKNRYKLDVQQVEDRELYTAVRERLSLLERSESGSFGYLLSKAEVDYLQERRTAAMIQKIPYIIDYEAVQGRIKNRKALFTIGLSHISDIIKYLKENKIAIYYPPFSERHAEDYIAEVNLCKSGFGVTIILPRILADNQELLMTTHLDALMTHLHETASPASSVSLQ
jgi:hypothetical protein